MFQSTLDIKRNQKTMKSYINFIVNICNNNQSNKISDFSKGCKLFNHFLSKTLEVRHKSSTHNPTYISWIFSLDC